MSKLKLSSCHLQYLWLVARSMITQTNSAHKWELAGITGRETRVGAETAPVDRGRVKRRWTAYLFQTPPPQDVPNMEGLATPGTDLAPSPTTTEQEWTSWNSSRTSLPLTSGLHYHHNPPPWGQIHECSPLPRIICGIALGWCDMIHKDS